MMPVQRTLQELRKRGLMCEKVEWWNAFAGVRRDLFGIIDILVLDRSRGFVGIQCCGISTFSEHFLKMTHEKCEVCREWLLTPSGHLEIWQWRKLKVKRGSKASTWTPRVRVITMADIKGY